MPNHCEQDLYITGSNSELRRFKNDMQTNRSVLDEEVIFPMPKSLDMVPGLVSDDIYDAWFVNQDKKEMDRLREQHNMRNQSADAIAHLLKHNLDNYGCFDWYRWAVANWGTKWGIYEAEIIEESDKQLVYFFLSAWAPAVGIIKKASELYPSLEFTLRYFEGGMGYQGVMVFEEGKMIFEKEKEYNGPRGG